MRILFLIILLAGLALAGYPWISANLLEHPVGTWRVYDAATGYLPAFPRLQESDAPVRVLVDMTTAGVQNLTPGEAVLTLTVTTGGRTVLAKALTFADAQPRDTNPQTREKVFRDTAGVIDPVQSGDYLFTFGKGDAEDVPIQAVDLVLRHETLPPDDRLQPLGFVAMAVGFVGLVLAWRRGSGGGRPENPNSQPPPPRWGRGGASS